MALIRPSLRQPYQVTQEELDARAAQSYAQERTDNFLPFDIMAGADMSAANMAADAASARRIEAEIAGDPAAEAAAKASYEQDRLRADALGPRVRSIRDIGGVGDALDYAGGMLGMGAQSMSPAIAASLAVGGVGGLGLRAVGAGAEALLANRGLLGVADFGIRAASQAARLPGAGVAGAYVPSYTQNQEAQLSRQYENPETAGRPAEERLANSQQVGLVAGALDAVVPGLLGKGLAFGGSRLGHMAGAALTEGTTETAQEEVSLQGQKALGSTEQRDPVAYADAFLGGAIGGGGVSSILGGPKKAAAPAPEAAPAAPAAPAPPATPPKPLVNRIEDALRRRFGNAHNPTELTDQNPELRTQLQNLDPAGPEAAQVLAADDARRTARAAELAAKLPDALRSTLGQTPDFSNRVTQAAVQTMANAQDLAVKAREAIKALTTRPPGTPNAPASEGNSSSLVQRLASSPWVRNMAEKAIKALGGAQSSSQTSAGSPDAARRAAEQMSQLPDDIRAVWVNNVGENPDFSNQEIQDRLEMMTRSVQAAKRETEMRNAPGGPKMNLMQAASPEAQAQYDKLIVDGLRPEVRGEMGPFASEIANTLLAYAGRTGELTKADARALLPVGRALDMFQDPDKLITDLIKQAGVSDKSLLNYARKFRTAETEAAKEGSFLQMALTPEASRISLQGRIRLGRAIDEFALEATTDGRTNLSAESLARLGRGSETATGGSSTLKLLTAAVGSEEKALRVLDYYTRQNTQGIVDMQAPDMNKRDAEEQAPSFRTPDGRRPFLRGRDTEDMNQRIASLNEFEDPTDPSTPPSSRTMSYGEYVDSLYAEPQSAEPGVKISRDRDTMRVPGYIQESNPDVDPRNIERQGLAAARGSSEVAYVAARLESDLKRRYEKEQLEDRPTQERVLDGALTDLDQINGEIEQFDTEYRQYVSEAGTVDPETKAEYAKESARLSKERTRLQQKISSVQKRLEEKKFRDDRTEHLQSLEDEYMAVQRAKDDAKKAGKDPRRAVLDLYDVILSPEQPGGAATDPDMANFRQLLDREVSIKNDPDGSKAEYNKAIRSTTLRFKDGSKPMNLSAESMMYAAPNRSGTMLQRVSESIGMVLARPGMTMEGVKVKTKKDGTPVLNSAGKPQLEFLPEIDNVVVRRAKGTRPAITFGDLRRDAEKREPGVLRKASKAEILKREAAAQRTPEALTALEQYTRRLKQKPSEHALTFRTKVREARALDSKARGDAAGAKGVDPRVAASELSEGDVILADRAATIDRLAKNMPGTPEYFRNKALLDEMENELDNWLNRVDPIAFNDTRAGDIEGGETALFGKSVELSLRKNLSLAAQLEERMSFIALPNGASSPLLDRYQKRLEGLEKKIAEVQDDGTERSMYGTRGTASRAVTEADQAVVTARDEVLKAKMALDGVARQWPGETRQVTEARNVARVALDKAEAALAKAERRAALKLYNATAKKGKSKTGSLSRQNVKAKTRKDGQREQFQARVREAQNRVQENEGDAAPVRKDGPVRQTPKVKPQTDAQREQFLARVREAVNDTSPAELNSVVDEQFRTYGASNEQMAALFETWVRVYGNEDLGQVAVTLLERAAPSRTQNNVTGALSPAAEDRNARRPRQSAEEAALPAIEGAEGKARLEKPTASSRVVESEDRRKQVMTEGEAYVRSGKGFPEMSAARDAFAGKKNEVVQAAQELEAVLKGLNKKLSTEEIAASRPPTIAELQAQNESRLTPEEKAAIDASNKVRAEQGYKPLSGKQERVRVWMRRMINQVWRVRGKAAAMDVIASVDGPVRKELFSVLRPKYQNEITMAGDSTLLPAYRVDPAVADVQGPSREAMAKKLGSFGAAVSPTAQAQAGTEARARQEARIKSDARKVARPGVKVPLPVTGPYTAKDQAKWDRANKFIGRGSPTSSTQRYASAIGPKLANTGTYASSDVVFVSAEGDRTGRVEPDPREIKKAVDAGATIVTDDKANRARAYNIGERQVAAFLSANGYVEEGATGIWKPASKLNAQSDARKVKRMNLQGVTTAPTPVTHWTTPESAAAIAREGFDTARAPVHGVASDKSDKATVSKLGPPGTMYFTQDPERWSTAQRDTAPGEGTEDRDFYDYKTREWTTVKKGATTDKLTPLKVEIKAGTNLLVLDSLVAFQSFEFAEPANSQDGRGHSALDQVLRAAKRKGYDGVHLSDRGDWSVDLWGRDHGNRYAGLTADSGKDDFFIFNRDVVELSTGKKNAQSAQSATGTQASLAQVKAAMDEILRILGPKVRTVFNDFLQIGGSGSFTYDPALQEELIQIAHTAANTNSIAHHEALHAFIRRLNADEVVDILGNVTQAAATPAMRKLSRDLLNGASAPQVQAKLRELLQGEPAALRQLSDAEERAAYAFQFWVADPTIFRLGPTTQNVFQRFAKFVQGLLGVVSQSDQFEALLQALHEGKFADPSAVDRVLAQMQKDGKTETAEEKLKRVLGSVHKVGTKVFVSQTDRLRSFNSNAMDALALKFFQDVGLEKGSDPGMIQRRSQREGIWMNRLQKLFDGTTKVEQQTALNELRLRRAASPLALEIRKFLDQMEKYLSAAEVKRWTPGGWVALQKVANYFPRRWDSAKIKDRETEFRTLLALHGAKDIDLIVKALTEGDGISDLAESEHHLGFTPQFANANVRTLDDVVRKDLAAFAEFQNDNLLGTMGIYVQRAVHRAEYARDFGNNGEKIKEAFEQAAREGLTPEQLAEAAKTVRGLEGTLGNDIDPKWKKLSSMILTAENVVLLPFVLFSQMIDPMGIALRTGKLADAGKAYMRSLRELKSAFTKQKSQGKELAEMLGIIQSESMYEAMGQTHGSTYLSDSMRSVNRWFFKYNGLNGWNNSMRIAATVAGQRYILDKQNDVTRMDELGLSKEHVVELPGRKIAISKDDFLAAGKTDAQATEAAARMRTAMFRFVDSAIIRPNAAHRATWMADPRFMLVAHLKQFTFSFHQVILRRVQHEATLGNSWPSMAIWLNVPLMLASSMAKWTMLGRVPQNWTFLDHMVHAYNRSGLAGKRQFGIDAYADLERGRPPGVSFAGPTAEHATLLAQYAAGSASASQVIDRTVPLVRNF